MFQVIVSTHSKKNEWSYIGCPRPSQFLGRIIHSFSGRGFWIQAGLAISRGYGMVPAVSGTTHDHIRRGMRILTQPPPLAPFGHKINSVVFKTTTIAPCRDAIGIPTKSEHRIVGMLPPKTKLNATWRSTSRAATRFIGREQTTAAERVAIAEQLTRAIPVNVQSVWG